MDQHHLLTPLTFFVSLPLFETDVPTFTPTSHCDWPDVGSWENRVVLNLSRLHTTSPAIFLVNSQQHERLPGEPVSIMYQYLISLSTAAHHTGRTEKLTAGCVELRVWKRLLFEKVDPVAPETRLLFLAMTPVLQFSIKCQWSRLNKPTAGPVMLLGVWGGGLDSLSFPRHRTS